MYTILLVTCGILFVTTIISIFAIKQLVYERDAAINMGSILVARLREMGVLVKADGKSSIGLDFKYTDAAAKHREASYFPSIWNLEQEIQYQRTVKELKPRERNQSVAVDAAPE